MIVECGDIVNGQFHAETGGINDEKCPDAVVFNRQHEGFHAFTFRRLKFTAFTEFFIVSVRCILGEEIISKPRDK